MIIQLQVLNRIVKRINLLFIISIIAIPLLLVLLNIIAPNADLRSVLVVVIPFFFICFIVFSLLRYLYLSYATIEQVTFQKPKFNGNYFILTLILPFLNIIVAPFYLFEMTKYYEYSKKDKITYMCSFVFYELFCIINTLRIIFKNIDNLIFSDIGKVIFSAIEMVVMVIISLVFVNTLSKNQKNKLEKIVKGSEE